MVILWILLALILLVLGISYGVYRFCFYSPADRKEDPYALLDGEQYQAVSEHIFKCTRIMEQTPCEFVETTAFDETGLSARYYGAKPGSPVMLLFHGYRSMALRDGAGGFLLGKKLGFHVLAVDQRAHGRSGGKTITFGINERRDVLAWVDYCRQRFGENVPIVISGLSMGAATVLMASECNLPSNVQCGIADCPYSAPAAIIRKVCGDMKIPAKLAYPFVRLGAYIFGGFDLEECNARDAVRNSRIPLLLLHGENDDFVPCQMSIEIAAANKALCQVHTFPEAGHGLCYMVDPVRYERLNVAFLTAMPGLSQFMSQSEYAKKIMGSEVSF